MMNSEQIEKIIKRDSQENAAERISPATITLGQIQEILDSNDHTKGRQIIFRRNFKNRLSDARLDNHIIEDFEEVIKRKPHGAWLIRESRQPGMVSITYNQTGVVKHDRYAFVHGKWGSVSNSEISDIAKKCEYMSRTNIANSCQSLLEVIFADRGWLKMDKLVFPLKDQYSLQNEYGSYVIAVEENAKVYNNPVEALKDIDKKIDALLKKSNTEIAQMDLSFLKTHSTSSPRIEIERSDQLEERFCAWLISENLEKDVFSPISLELFKNPHVLADSGIVLDGDELFHNAKLLETCPITRTRIEKNPYRIEGWNRQLEECLQKFQLLIDKCSTQEVAATNTTTTSRTTNSKVATGGFFSSSIPAANQVPSLPSQDTSGSSSSATSEEERLSATSVVEETSITSGLGGK
jgi:hypothetical protein